MSDSVYKKISLIGSSVISWEDAAKNAIERAGVSLKDLRVAEVVRKDIKMDDTGVVSYRTQLAISFKIVDV
ncbi:MAG: dodecin domain-containing protein [Proteobacteria bacterium]|nr:dodecin domain-containing protein [Pseudomonadota bacterium]